MNRSQTDLFSGEHASLEPAAVGPATPDSDVAALAADLPPLLRMGTSSWSFPGWAGLVYDRVSSQRLLARKGLAAYAAHPLLRCVGVDRTYYEPLLEATFREYADAVPASFRFLVKADRRLTFPHLASSLHPGGADPPRGERAARFQARGGVHSANPLFLDASYATEFVVGPAMRGLSDRLGCVLFQFPPIRPSEVGGPGGFAGRLRQFLSGLPSGVPYAVEVRTPEFLTGAYRDALAAHGVSHTYTVHPTMPSLRRQETAIPLAARSPLIVRWMLGQGRKYEDAKAEYQPFDRLRAEDVTSRRWIATACVAALHQDRPTMVIVNNKAEGSAPLSIGKLARMISTELAS